MTNGKIFPGAATLLGALAVAGALLVGILMRLVDPLSTVVIAAEDPYTHMALIREHVRTGTLDPLNQPGGLYPPGMHAFLTATWAFMGTELYHIFRLGPALLGGIGILGMGVLLWRNAGPVAGFVGALGYAVAPEVIFRTTMMSPTALDLALIPFFLFAILEVLSGDHRWLGVAALMTGFFVFAHPWVIAILAGAAIGLVALALAFPWPSTRSPRASLLGMASVLSVLGVGFGLALTGCAGYCGPGLSTFLPDALTSPAIGLLIIAASMVPPFLLRGRAHALRTRVREARPRPASVWAKAAVSLVLGGAFLAVTWMALSGGMPFQVDLPRMFGWPILGLALFAFLLLPFLSSRMAYLGAAFCAVTYPFVVFNPFNSPFWPHRTAVFFGIGLTLLLGVGAAGIERWGTHAFRRAQERVPLVRGRRFASSLLLVPALLVAFSMGGAVFAGTPDGYTDGWYRLYEPCEFEAFQEVQDEIDDDESAIVVTGSWQPRLVLSALDDNPSRIWADTDFFWSEQYRGDLMAQTASDGDDLYVLTDRQMEKEHGNMDTGFLEGDNWEQVGSWCSMMGSPEPRMHLYKMREAPL